MHSVIPGSELSAQDLELLSELPLENLPTVLKLGGTLACLGGLGPVYRQASQVTQLNVGQKVFGNHGSHQILAHEDVTDELIEVVAKSAGRFTKT